MYCFSVVIPLFNKEKTIIRAVNSVLAQKNQNIEIIIVDDGSTDQSCYFVSKIKNKKIKIIKQKNKGVSSARNNGIKAATYDYIAFLDADDTWDPDYLEIITDLIDNNKNCGAYSTHIRDYSNKNVFPAMFYEEIKKNNSFVVKNLFSFFASEYYPISSSSVCIKKSILIEIGCFNERLVIGEDIDTWIRVFLKSSIVISNRYAATYFRDADNRSVDRYDFWQKQIEFFLYLRNSYLDNNLSPECFKCLDDWSDRRIYNSVIGCINEKNFSYAFHLIKKYSNYFSHKIIILSYLRFIYKNFFIRPLFSLGVKK